jgi:peptide deformylase
MAILKVARLGHPVLRTVASPVAVNEIRSTETQRLIDDMIETMREYNGAGLAAPQVHTLKQICVIEINASPRYPDAPSIPLTVLVNPVVIPLTDEMEDGWEGCLSVPDMRGVVPRHTAVRLEAYDREGGNLGLVAKEFFARVIQHETDHLNGIDYVDRMRISRPSTCGVEQVLDGDEGRTTRHRRGQDLFFVARIREQQPSRHPLSSREPRAHRRARQSPGLVIVDLTTRLGYGRSRHGPAPQAFRSATHALARQTSRSTRCDRVVTKKPARSSQMLRRSAA